MQELQILRKEENSITLCGSAQLYPEEIPRHCMTDEEIYRCYRIWEEYRWKRQDFNRALERWFEDHHHKEHNHGNDRTAAPKMRQVLHLQADRRTGGEKERQLALDLCVRPLEDGRAESETDSQL